MKVIIQYFTKGEFGEQAFSNPTLHATGEEELYNLIRKAVGKVVDATCFVYLEDNVLRQVYFKVWKEHGKVIMQPCSKVTGKAEVTGRPKHTTIKQCVEDIYNLYWLTPEDKRKGVMV